MEFKLRHGTDKQPGNFEALAILLIRFGGTFVRRRDGLDCGGEYQVFELEFHENNDIRNADIGRIYALRILGCNSLG